MSDQTTPAVPPAIRRNHWMNHVARHASMQPDATAFRYLGADTFLDGRLARFKHPKDVVALDELPRNASGKVIKGVLREKDPT
jgi:acyl-CoA synthetase (AMP-forming)/AMP-acid ligase II